jgi:hypothetical protein
MRKTKRKLAPKLGLIRTTIRQLQSAHGAYEAEAKPTRWCSIWNCTGNCCDDYPYTKMGGGVYPGEDV